MTEIAESPADPASHDAAAGRAGKIEYYYLSDLLKARVWYEDEPRPFGHLYDLGANRGLAYPPITCLRVKSRRDGMVTLPWSSVRDLSEHDIVVRRPAAPASAADFWVRRDVLDDQVVDVSGAQVVRVNDVHMLHAEGQLVLGHVEVGMLGLLHRLGFERPVNALLRWLMDYSIKESFITWRFVEVLSPGGSPGGLRVSTTPSRLAGMLPGELAGILEELGVNERQRLFQSLPVEAAAQALGEVEPEVQRTLIMQAEPARAATILDEMTSREAAGVLRDLRGAEAQKILNRMETETAEEVKELLAHGERTAGGVMATSCIEARPKETASAVLERIRSQSEEVEVFNRVFVLDETRCLTGMLSLRELLRAKPDALLETVMTRQLVTVKADTKLRDVARLFVKYGFRNIPVVDEQGVFLGAVSFRYVLTDLAALLRD